MARRDASGDRFVICSGSDPPNVSADASAVQIASALAASALVIIPRQCQSGMRR